MNKLSTKWTSDKVKRVDDRLMHFGADLEITLRQSVEHLLTDRIAGDLGLPQGFAVFIDDFQLDVTILFRLEIGGQFSAYFCILYADVHGRN